MMNLTTTRNVRADSAAKKKSKSTGKPRLSWALAAAVVSLQGGLLLTLAITSLWEPPRVRAIESLWVWVQEVSVYPWLLLLVGGPVLTWLACRLDRKKLAVLSLSWAVFGVTLVTVFGAQAQLMLRWLWGHWWG